MSISDRRDIDISGGMAVDWPKAEDEVSSTKSARRAVSFSPTSQLFIIPQESTNTNSMFYSREDVDIFRHILRHDIQQMRRLFASREAVSTRGFYSCIGLEQFTSQEVLQRIMLARRAHIQAVLRVQEQQRLRRSSGADTDTDTDGIAMVSMVSSRWARLRAENIASNYAHRDKVQHE